MVKQIGNFLVGDVSGLESYTSDWFSVTLHPTTYYRRLDDMSMSLDAIRGMCAEIDTGESVVIRFSDKSDMTAFYKRHHEYI